MAARSSDRVLHTRNEKRKEKKRNGVFFLSCSTGGSPFCVRFLEKKFPASLSHLFHDLGRLPQMNIRSKVASYCIPFYFIPSLSLFLSVWFTWSFFSFFFFGVVPFCSVGWNSGHFIFIAGGGGRSATQWIFFLSAEFE